MPETIPHIPQDFETSEFIRIFFRVPDDVNFGGKSQCVGEKSYFHPGFASSWLCDLRQVILLLQASEEWEWKSRKAAEPSHTVICWTEC